MRQELKLKA